MGAGEGCPHLGAMGPAAARPEVLQALLECLRDEDEPVRGEAADALKAMGPAAAATEIPQALRERLRHADEDVGWEAGPASEAMRPAAATPEVLQALLERLRDEDEDVRKAAARTFAAYHRQGLRFFRDAWCRWTVRTVEELSGRVQGRDEDLRDGEVRLVAGTCHRREASGSPARRRRPPLPHLSPDAADLPGSLAVPAHQCLDQQQAHTRG